MGAEEILKVNVVIADKDQLKESLSIRREVYCSTGKLSPTCLKDPFDNKAIHFLGGLDNQWVSSARIVADDSKFEMEKYFDLSQFRESGKCFEINRFGILPQRRGGAIAYAMFRGFYRFALPLGVRYFCIVATPGHNSRMYQRIGFIKVGETVMYEELNAIHDAYVLDIPNAVEEWRTNRPEILKFFEQPISGIG